MPPKSTRKSVASVSNKSASKKSASKKSASKKSASKKSAPKKSASKKSAPKKSNTPKQQGSARRLSASNRAAEGFVVNPDTGRHMLENGAVGKKILENMAAKCADDQVLNPSSMRCVQRDGAAGSLVIEQNKILEWVAKHKRAETMGFTREQTIQWYITWYKSAPNALTQGV